MICKGTTFIFTILITRFFSWKTRLKMTCLKQTASLNSFYNFNNRQHISGSSKGQILRKNWRFFYKKKMISRTYLTFSTVEKSSCGICFVVSYRCAIRFQKFQFRPGSHTVAEKWRSLFFLNVNHSWICIGKSPFFIF